MFQRVVLPSREISTGREELYEVQQGECQVLSQLTESLFLIKLHISQADLPAFLVFNVNRKKLSLK